MINVEGGKSLAAVSTVNNAPYRRTSVLVVYGDEVSYGFDELGAVGVVNLVGRVSYQQL